MTAHAIGTVVAAVLTAAWVLCGLCLVAGLIGLTDAPPPADRQRRRLMVCGLMFVGFVMNHLWRGLL
jgi:hypothetical protein